MLGGPWRLTEPCDVTVGGATWLDQAQETAARTIRMQVHTGGRRGNRELHQSIKGQVPYRIREATDSCRATQEKNGTRELPTNSKNVHTGPETERRCKERHGTADRKEAEDRHNQV